MNRSRFAELLDAYGSDPDRWPADERDAALAHLRASAPARAALAQAEALDRALDRAPFEAPRLDAATVARTASAAPQRREPPARPRPIFSLFGAWPNFAGLAAAAVAGFVVGWSGLDPLTPDTSTAPADQGVYMEDLTW